MFQKIIIFRLFKIIFSLLPPLLSLINDSKHFFIFPRFQPISSQMHKARAHSLRNKFVKLGPTFIKLGQILSCREDFLPKEYIDELSQLQDQVPPAPFKKIKKLLDSEYGKDCFEVFDSIEETPIASASIAQVHVAILNGEKLALKILRPGVEECIEADLKLLPLIVVVFQTFTRFGKIGRASCRERV